MNNNQNRSLTPSQFTLTLKSIIIGIEILYLPNNIIKIAKQDSWISCILGIIYPLYLVLIADYMSKKFPKDNILGLSKRFFGSFLGSFFNFIFISFFLFMLTAELSGYDNVAKIYGVPFLQNFQIILITLLPIAYLAYKGIKALGRVNEVGFYITLVIIFLPIPIFAIASPLNIMPILGTPVINIIKGVKETTLAYSGMEIIFLIYPFLQDTKKLLKCGITCIAIVGSIYTWTTFATIYYLGIDIAPKYLWPVLSWADSIRIPIITSFRYVFLSLWSIVQFKCMATYYFAVSYGLNQSIKKISYENVVLLLYPIIIYISLLYGNPTMRRYYVYKILQMYIIFNLIYISIIAALVFIKRGVAHESS